MWQWPKFSLKIDCVSLEFSVFWYYVFWASVKIPEITFSRSNPGVSQCFSHTYDLYWIWDAYVNYWIPLWTSIIALRRQTNREALGNMASMNAVCPWLWVLRFKKLIPFPVSNNSFSGVQMKCGLSATAPGPSLPVCCHSPNHDSDGRGF